LRRGTTRGAARRGQPARLRRGARGLRRDPTGYLVAANEGGISNFGVHAVTVVPYTVAFLGAAGLLAAAARGVGARTPTLRRLAGALRVLAAALVVVLASTYGYKATAWLHDAHVAVAVAATVAEAAIATWLVAAVSRGPADRGALAVQLGAVLLAGCSLAGWVHVLLAAQLTDAVAFAVVVVRGAAAAVAAAEPGLAGRSAGGPAPGATAGRA
jgi:hypothetical protein